jgi:hypothetical protein
MAKYDGTEIVSRDAKAPEGGLEIIKVWFLPVRAE